MSGCWELAQSVKTLLHQHRGHELSAEPTGMMANAYDPNSGETETGGLWNSVAGQPS